MEIGRRADRRHGGRIETSIGFNPNFGAGEGEKGSAFPGTDVSARKPEKETTRPIHRPFNSESAVVMDNSGVLALFPLVIFPIFGIFLDIIPLPLLGLPPAPAPLNPPCCHSAPAYPNGALSLLARLDDFFGTVNPAPPPPPVPEPGDDTEDINDIDPSPDPIPFTPTLTPLSSIRWRFVLPRPEGGGSHEPSSNRSIVEIDPGEEGKGVEDVPSPR